MFRFLAGRAATTALAALISTALIGWVASDGFTTTFRSGISQPTAVSAPAHAAAQQAAHARAGAAQAARYAAPDVEVPSPGSTLTSADRRGRSLAGGIASAVWKAVTVFGTLLALLCSPLVATRLWGRARRRYRRYRLIPGRTDDASPERVTRMYEAWQQQLLVRWWGRLLFGQPALSVETHTIPARQGGGTEPRFFVTVPDLPGLAEALAGPLLACYPDARLELVADRHPGWLVEVVRLKKRHEFVQRIRTVERYEPALMDSVVATMAKIGEPITLQVTLTPAPALFDRFSRWLFRQEEERAERARLRRDGDRGASSGVVEQELEGGLAVQHRPLFFFDLRVSARSYDACKLVAGVVRGEATAENRLVERRMRARRGLFARRVALGRPNLVPSFRRGVLSSLELASLWHLSSPYLRGVRMERTAVPRVPAPPEIQRPGRVGAIGRDEHGYVGIKPADWRMNLALVATQGVGKTSIERQLVEAAAQDPNAAIFVLDPKSDLAEEALSVIPESREVAYCDFKDPEVGFNPFLPDADPEVVADGIVAAFKDVFEDGEIMNSSDRYLRYSAIAALVAFEDPSLWDLYNLLLPGCDEPRGEVAAALAGKPAYAAPYLFFDKQLPEQLAASRSQFVARLEAPTNKIQRVLTPELQKVLRHPVSINADELIARRGIAVFNGRVGHFGDDNVRVLMQFVLHGIHRALIRQQDLPEADRARVVLVVDEAHLLFSETFQRMLAMDRSSGLECIAAWQSLHQIRDRDLRSVILGLLRNLCVGSVGAEDARELATRLQTAYVDSVRDDEQSRRRSRISPDALINLPNHHFGASLIADGSRTPSFVFETIPMGRDEDRIGHHLNAQRQRGGHTIDVPLPPQRVIRWTADDTPEALTGRIDGTVMAPEEAEPDAVERGLAEPRLVPQQQPEPAAVVAEPDESTPADQPEEDPDAATEATGPEGEPEPASATAQAERQPVTSAAAPARAAAPDAPLGAPESLTELDLDRPTGLTWDRTPPEPPDRSRKRRGPRQDELETLAALHQLRFMFVSQIGRLTMPGQSRRTVQHRLGALHTQGLVRRCQFATGTAGPKQRIYSLTPEGFALAQQHRRPRGHYIDPRQEWSEQGAVEPIRILHDLHVNGWVIAFMQAAGGLVRGYRGPRNSHLNPPGKMVRGEWVPMPKTELPLGSGESLRDLLEQSWVEKGKFEAVHPDATIECMLSLPGGAERRIDVLVEMDRTRKPGLNKTKFHRYDSLLTIWARALERYKMLGEPPIVVFVCDDERTAFEFARAADREVGGRIAQVGKPEADWPAPARARMFFVAEADMHSGSPRAFKLPEHPPEVRKALASSRRATPFEPVQLEFLPSRLFQGRQAT